MSLLERFAAGASDTILRGADRRAQTAEDLARIQANQTAQSGQNWGRTLQQLGQIPQEIQQQRQAQQLQAEQSQLRQQQLKSGALEIQGQQQKFDANAALTAAIQQGTKTLEDGTVVPDRDKIKEHLRMGAGAALIPSLEADWTKQDTAALNMREARQKVNKAEREALGEWASGGLNALKAGGDPNDVAGLLLPDLAAHGANGDVDPQTTARIATQLNDARSDPAKLSALLTDYFTKANPPKAEAGFSLNPGETRFDASGKQIANVPAVAKTATPPNTGSFEDFVVRAYGQTPTPEQILKARKDYGQADDRPRVNVSVAGGGGADKLTTDAIEDTATKYRILGTNAIPTRIEGDERVRIMNAAAKQQRALGQTAAQAVQKQAAFKSDSASLTQIQKMASSAEAFENKALAQADLIGDLSKKVDRTQSPLFNAWLLSGKQKVVGDKNTQLLFNALDTFTSEYAKIMAGSTGSAGASSDAATRKAEGLISAALNKGTFQATLDQMKWEMDQTRKGYDATIAHITDRMGGAPQQAAPAVNAPAVQQWQRDASGKLVPVK